ncbi:hypothetical protein DPMN_051395 [Dreissena polymorpha]|uniref:Uncharacterized protein n=1 Tax=Dreissena polymorpha TaxID=45954 RepID=A0A9D4CHS4_DREPO|nr:hypothetical protein DPMN_051395 [Dreissena polymorpha]
MKDLQTHLICDSDSKNHLVTDDLRTSYVPYLFFRLVVVQTDINKLLLEPASALSINSAVPLPPENEYRIASPFTGSVQLVGTVKQTLESVSSLFAVSNTKFPL